MTSAAPASGTPAAVMPKAVELFLFALCIANVAWLGTSFMTGAWIRDLADRLISTDFVNVYAAGKLALAGRPAAAYDWTIHRQAEIAVLGYDFGGYYGWHYPPPYLFVASVLALLPYVAAHAGWTAVSFFPYVAAVRASAGHASGFLLACAVPPLIANVLVGQNGFLTAALIGGTLALLPRRPALAGICLGFLIYKPHFGILFPFVLAAAGYWRTFFAAACTAAALSIASLAAYGVEPWLAFLRWLPVTSQAFLSDGRAEIEKMQSLFAIVRTLGGAEWLAWTVQIALAAAILAALVWLWRSREQPYELKAAALGAGVLLATPYIYLYDIVSIAIPVAFLLGLGLRQGFRPYELPALAFAALLLLSFPFVKLPVGFAAVLIAGLLAARRALYPVASAAK